MNTNVSTSAKPLMKLVNGTLKELTSGDLVVGKAYVGTWSEEEQRWTYRDSEDNILFFTLS